MWTTWISLAYSFMHKWRTIFASTINREWKYDLFYRAFLSNCTPHATEAFSPIDHQSRGLWGPSYRGSSAGVSGCLSMFHTIVIGWSPVASHFNLTTSPLRAVSLRNLFSKRGGTEIISKYELLIIKLKPNYVKVN